LIVRDALTLECRAAWKFDAVSRDFRIPFGHR
jgi:hypothetical protein